MRGHGRALLIAIGGAIGGGALYLFVALPVGMNVVGYWFSDKLALRASGFVAADQVAARRDSGGRSVSATLMGSSSS